MTLPINDMLILSPSSDSEFVLLVVICDFVFEFVDIQYAYVKTISTLVLLNYVNVELRLAKTI